MSIRLACLDMAGTTISDDGSVERAFTVAVAEMGFEVGGTNYLSALSVVRQTMGRSKIEVFGLIFGKGAQAAAANAVFERAYDEEITKGAIFALPGAEEVLRALRGSGVQICLTTGFAPVTRDRLIDELGWYELVDLALSPADVGRGRPYPDLIWAAAERLDVDELADVVVVGDTPSDMAAGIAAGAGRVVGVLSGNSTADQLRDAGASDVLPSIAGLLALTGAGLR